MDGDALGSEGQDEGLPGLIERLGQALARPPIDDEDRKGRALEINLLMAGVDEQGVDAAALVRFGMKSVVWLPIMISLISTPESDRTSPDRAIDFDGWLDALSLSTLPASTPEADLSDHTVASAFRAMADRAVRRLPRWAEVAPIKDLIELTPPEAGLLETIPAGTPSEEVSEAYQWVWERYGRPGFDKWSSSSLRLEYLWREGTWVPPFPAEALVVDRATDAPLHREIAARFVASPIDMGESDLLSKLQEQAVQFLGQSRWAEAAALFEFYLEREPDNCTARNNLGFCLLPQDASLALTHLEGVGRAADINRTMLAHNICTALSILGRHPEALDKAEYHWQRDDPEDRGGAYLWRLDEESVELYYAADIRLALAELGLVLAQTTGASARENRWQERIGNLKNPAPQPAQA